VDEPPKPALLLTRSGWLAHGEAVPRLDTVYPRCSTGTVGTQGHRNSAIGLGGWSAQRNLLIAFQAGLDRSFPRQT
jgi:hypothetical protein